MIATPDADSQGTSSPWCILQMQQIFQLQIHICNVFVAVHCLIHSTPSHIACWYPTKSISCQISSDEYELPQSPMQNRNPQSQIRNPNPQCYLSQNTHVAWIGAHIGGRFFTISPWNHGGAALSRVSGRCDEQRRRSERRVEKKVEWTEKNGRRLFILSQLMAERVRPSNYATYDLTCGPHLPKTWLTR
jgi:hypothetical protein